MFKTIILSLFNRFLHINLPQTISKVHAKNCLEISKASFWPINCARLSTMIFVFSLKTGMNDESILLLNVGLSSFLIGFQICAKFRFNILIMGMVFIIHFATVPLAIKSPALSFILM